MPDTLTIVVPDAMLRAALATALVDLGHRLEAAVGQPITFVIFAGRAKGKPTFSIDRRVVSFSEGDVYPSYARHGNLQSASD